MKLGVETYFHQVNLEGGIDGRALELIAMDDGYVPDAAVRNMNHLIDKERVLAVIGNVGTPTAKLTVPIAIEKKTLLFGAFTGAGLLRQPPNRYVINYRASYAQETAAMVQGLLAAGILPYEIAIFSQNDAYGDAGYSGVIEGLEAAGYEDAWRLAHGRYERNTLDVKDALLTILDAPVRPRAIIMIGSYAPCARFIEIARRAFAETHFLNVSFVGSKALKEALGPQGEGVIVTQVVPHFAADLPITHAYRQDLLGYDPTAEPGFVSLEGYIVARIFVEGLRRAGEEITRESIIDALLAIRDLDIGLGTPISYSDELYQGSQTVWPTIIRDGEFRPVDLADLLED
jgi:ABC-type branched-subunit amino acid transport system substrate-binding protein